MNGILHSAIEYLKGVGPQRAELLRKELEINTCGDLLQHFPYRHLDKSQVTAIGDLAPGQDFVQVKGVLSRPVEIGEKASRRLVARLSDSSGSLELVWFRGISWLKKYLEEGRSYLVFGRLGFYLGQPQLVHPEMEAGTQQADAPGFEPVYPSTEKLKTRGLNGRQLARLTESLFTKISAADIPEILPEGLLHKLKLMERFTAYQKIHFPSSMEEYEQALKRLKFDELFTSQIRMQQVRIRRQRFSKGRVFDRVGEHFHTFYEKHLPFELTGAQKRVLKEIRNDTAHGHQMNRLLQGDVGSGKTIVALLAMLLAIDNGCQACLMAPTEILARQHYQSIIELLDGMHIEVGILTGSTKASERKKLLAKVADGSLPLLIGTHALIETAVQFQNLGMAIVDEQHRFGVAQRARLWEKATLPPHILVMTATPIPRTLAMTAYGDLDCSIMDELPPGRQPVTTVHRLDDGRSKVMEFLKSQISEGRQVYIIFPLIEESDKLDYENLMKGYENVKAWFPEPQYWISMVHGRQPAQQKEMNMRRFVEGDTQIMVSTTVIEVGVNVPNATVMVIESAEKFGLSQLHQLRGRVGRGSDKSYCILLTSNKLSADAKERIKIMTSTNDGFLIAEKDLELRGPGDIAGTRQSGEQQFRLASLVNDKQMLQVAALAAEKIVSGDPELSKPENMPLKNYLAGQQGKTVWSRIS